MPDEIQQPSLSPQAIEDYRRLLNDPTFQRDYPERYRMLQASVSAALAETSQSLDPSSDGRTPAQAAFDRRMGVTTTPDGRPELPPDLAGILGRDADKPPDSATVNAELAGVGLDPMTARAAATLLLSQVGSQVTVEGLSAHQITQLSIYAAHIGAWQKGRPA